MVVCVVCVRLSVCVCRTASALWQLETAGVHLTHRRTKGGCPSDGLHVSLDRVDLSVRVRAQVWDDKYLGNSDFAYIYPFFTLEEINNMEIKFVKLLQYQVGTHMTCRAEQRWLPSLVRST